MHHLIARHLPEVLKIILTFLPKSFGVLEKSCTFVIEMPMDIDDERLGDTAKDIRNSWSACDA